VDRISSSVSQNRNRSAKEARSSLVTSVIAVIICIIFAIIFVVLIEDYLTRQQLLRKNDDLKFEIQALEEGINDNQKLAENLKNDEFTIKKVAREKHNFIEPGETVIRNVPAE
jgi:cell division protein FtsB